MDYILDKTQFTFIYIILVLYSMYQYMVKNDNLIIIRRLHSKNRFPSNKLQNYYVLYLEISNLHTYSQYYNSEISDNLFNQVYKHLRKHIQKKHLYVYRTDQIVIINEFNNTHVINNVIRDEEMHTSALKVSNYLKSQEYNIDGFKYDIKVNIGTASVGMLKLETAMPDIIRLAEFSMIKSKKNNNGIQIATEELRSIKQDLDSFNKEMENGLKLDEFVPYYFPIINTKTMKIAGVESLVRWAKDQYREIEASKFKDIANEKLLFEQIDKRVIQKTFSAYKTWLENDLVEEGFQITINLSYQALVNLDIKRLLLQVNEHNLIPENVSFDISEESIIKHNGIEVIKRLRNEGFKISLDALNNKWFSLETLLEIDLDSIKIKQTISNNSYQTSKQKILYQTLVEFSNRSNVNILSKGIETKQQLEYALQLNVDYVQGYYFTKPLSDENIAVYLNKYKNGIHTH